MAVLFKFSIIFCCFLFYTCFYCDAVGSTDLRVAEPSLNGFCEHFARQARIRKIFCVICKGFDLSCFTTTTTTTTTTTKSPHTITETTTIKTTEATTLRPSQVNNTATPSTRSDQDVTPVKQEEPSE